MSAMLMARAMPFRAIVMLMARAMPFRAIVMLMARAMPFRAIATASYAANKAFFLFTCSCGIACRQ